MGGAIVTAGEQQIHNRLNDLFEVVDRLTEKTALIDKRQEVFIAECQPCRKVVMGNGVQPIDKRVMAIEHRHAEEDKLVATSQRWRLASISVVAAIVSAAVGGLFQLLIVIKKSFGG
jgi:hypothetical protein